MAITIGDLKSFNLPDSAEIIISNELGINIETVQAGIARKHSEHPEEGVNVEIRKTL